MIEELSMVEQASPVDANVAVSPWTPDILKDAWSYGLDAFQRGILFLDVMRQRSQRREEYIARVAPNALKFRAELVMDGRTLPHPVNYVLARIVPPLGVQINERKRPFVIIDPRGGHGPGIGGFKAQSEIGVALNAGHPCYFVGFFPEPVPGQTIEKIAEAEAAFIERVIALHPKAEGKPAVIGNCQAGWAVMMVAAERPQLFGPIIVAGSPLSYWAGMRGANPMRYSGGLLGGSWLTALTGDLGNGKFDGAWLVGNFENLNPANTYWTKHYNLYSKVDSEAPRYLEFEEWWGAPVLYNAQEMQSIVDQLFIGNKLATAEIVSSDGTTIDLRNISVPIVVFCSKGDNITPPPQALDWILDLYESVDDMRAHAQTIVYAVHSSAGHLGIFVSGSVAKKEYAEFASNIDLIDVLPPGLYEAVITPKANVGEASDLVEGDYLVRFEARTFDDIKALGTNSPEDERSFAAAERVSEINLGLYRSFVQPWIRGWANEGFADWLRRTHPLRLQYEAFSPRNPLMGFVPSAAENVREHRASISEDNVFWQAQQWASNWITTWLNIYRDVRDLSCEAAFYSVYGSHAVQGLTGLNASEASPRRRPGVDSTYRAFVAHRTEELKWSVSEGGPREAAIRAALYVRLPEGKVDERGFRLLQQMREDVGTGVMLAEFKKLVRDQFFCLLLDQSRAVAAIPAMMVKEPELAAKVIVELRRLLDVVSFENDVSKARRAEIEALLKPSVTRSQFETVPSSVTGEAKQQRPQLRKVSGDLD